MHRWRILLILAVLLFGGSIRAVQAREFLQGTTCTVPADQHIVGNLFVFCQNLEMAGVVEGDLIGVALRGQISGTVTGGVYLSGGQIDLRGQVGQNIHFAGLLLGISPQDGPPVQPDEEERVPQYQGGLFNLSLSTVLEAETQLEGSITGIGYQMRVLGDVEREINYWGSRLTVGGWIHGDINASVGNPTSDASRIETLLLPLNFPVDLENPGLTIMDTGRVDGKLIYTGPAAGEIEGTLATPATYMPPSSNIPTFDRPSTFRTYAEGVIQEATTLFTIGLVMLLLSPTWPRQPMRILRWRPVASFSVGMLAFILSFPIVLMMIVLSLLVVAVLQLLTLNGVALGAAVMLLLANGIGMGIFYFVAIFVARIVIAMTIGTFLWSAVRRSDDGSLRIMLYKLVIGVVALSLLTAIPVIGWVVNAIALFFGLGTIFNAISERFRRMRDVPPPPPAARPLVATPPAPAPPTRPRITVEPVVPSPPPALNPPAAPGMDNLPDGFDWRFFED